MSTASASDAPRVAVLLGSLQGGGAERAMLRLARWMLAAGVPVDILAPRARGELLDELPPGARFFELGVPPLWQLPFAFRGLPRQTRRQIPRRPSKLMRALPRVVSYLRRERPAALLSTLAPVNVVALWAAQLANTGTRVVIRESTQLSMDAANPQTRLGPFFSRLVPEWYPRADGIVAVSDGAAADLCRFVGVPRTRVRTVYNGIDVAALEVLAKQDPGDPWLAPDEPPVLLSVARLGPEKDHETLLRAFARVRAERPVRMLVLGSGSKHSEARRLGLEALAAELDVAGDVRFAGFVVNPFPFMARSALLVLSSIWEGFPNVLLEALACGCPVVSTDCSSGPSELLDGGRYGRLVPVGDAEALAQAILATLAEAPRPDVLQARAREFSPERAAAEYLELLIGAPAGAAAGREAGGPDGS